MFEVPELGARWWDYCGLWSMEPLAAARLQEHVAGLDLQAHIAAHAAYQATPYAAERVDAGGRKIAVIKLAGILLKSQSSFGGTSTVQARREIRAAAADPDVAGILLHIDSPGGTVAGTDDLARDVKAAGKLKPVWAHIEDLGASAAYWVASQASRIAVNSPTALVGSIGTIQVVHDMSEAFQREGIRTLVFATGPLKGLGAPGAPITDEQAGHLQALINSTQETFDEAIRRGRGLTAKELAAVRHGGVLTAEAALTAKLVDAIQPLAQTLTDFGRTLKSVHQFKQGAAMPEGMENLQPDTEAQRIEAITKICGKDYQDICREAILANWSIDQTRQACLKKLRDDRALNMGPCLRRGYDTGSPDVLACHLVMRSVGEKTALAAFGPQVAQQARDLHCTSLVDLARLSLQLDGRPIPRDRHGLIMAAISTGSMPIALGDSANKILSAVYREAPASWGSFAAVRNAKDFKTNYSIRPNFLGNLEAVAAGGEIAHGSFSEATISWSVSTYAKMFSIDRKQIINDDLSAFSEIVPALGRSASRAVNDLIYTTLLANGGSHFSLAAGNYQEGAGTALSAASLAAALKLLRQQTDANGSSLDLLPATLLVPVDLEITARELLESTELARDVSSTDSLPTANALKGLAALAVEPRLSNTSFTGYSTTAWYLFCGPIDVPFIVGFLDGRESPVVEQFGLDHDVNTLAMSFRVYHDFGCTLGDPKTAIMSKGAA